MKFDQFMKEVMVDFLSGTVELFFPYFAVECDFSKRKGLTKIFTQCRQMVREVSWMCYWKWHTDGFYKKFKTKSILYLMQKSYERYLMLPYST